jgi:deoxyribonuclease-4
MIRFGPAGIPLSCKGRTLRDGIIDLHHLGLTAMEVQFIKVNSAVRPVSPEEVGKKPRDIADHLIVEVGLPGRKGLESSPGLLDKPLTKRNHLTTLNWFLAKDYNVLNQARTLARSVDIRLALHAPFYVDFLNTESARERTISNYRWSCALASSIGADVLVGHLGFYGPDGPTVSLERVTKDIKAVRDWLDGLPGGHRILIGIEPNGHPEVIGSREEVFQIAKKVPRVIPILNIPHLAVREYTSFEDKAELIKLMEEFSAVSRGELYINFSGVMVQGRGSFRMTPIKRGKVKFETVAEVLSDGGYDATVTSSSPLMEHDAMYMKLLYERALAKQFAKKAAEKKALALKAKAPPKPAPKPAGKAQPKQKPGKAPARGAKLKAGRAKGAAKAKPPVKAPPKPVKKAKTKIAVKPKKAKGGPAGRLKKVVRKK